MMSKNKDLDCLSSFCISAKRDPKFEIGSIHELGVRPDEGSPGARNGNYKIIGREDLGDEVIYDLEWVGYSN